MPVHTYTNWNSRPSDNEEQIEPFRKYFFICEGANTETFYFKRLIDLRKQLGIHPLIDIRLWEKTDEDRNLSFAKNLADFAESQKNIPDNDFDPDRDKMVIVFDGDIFEEKVHGYARWKEAQEHIDSEGSTFETDKGYQQQTPWVGIANTNQKLMIQEASEFGLTPSARSRIMAAFGVGKDEEDAHEPIVSQELFDKVQEMFAARKAFYSKKCKASKERRDSQENIFKIVLRYKISES